MVGTVAVLQTDRKSRNCLVCIQHEFHTTALCILAKTIRLTPIAHRQLRGKNKVVFFNSNCFFFFFYLRHRRLTYFLLFLVFLLFLAVRIVVSLFLLLFGIRVRWSFCEVKTETHLGQFTRCYTHTSGTARETFYSVPCGSGSCGRWCLCLCLLFFFGGCMCISLYCSGSWKRKKQNQNF